MTGGARGTGAIGLAAGAGLLAMAACAPIPLVNVAPGADGTGSGGARAGPSLSEAPVPRPRWKPGAAGGRESQATVAARSVGEGADAGGPAREAATAAGRVPTPRLRPGAPPPDSVRAGEGFLWPIEGPLLSRFGPKPGGRHNDGINIAAPVGSAVRAARDGVVAYAGNEIGGYGNLVLIRHRDGWMTAYAHNESLLVRKGEAVRRGQVISRSGNSGRVSRPQAHFEIRRHGEPQDPLRLLSRE